MLPLLRHFDFRADISLATPPSFFREIFRRRFDCDIASDSAVLLMLMR
jgi:hypothetical protein